MPVSRGDVVLAFVENVGTSGGKLRPALVVQSDRNNSRLNETIIAAITSNTSRIDEAHQLLIDISTEEGAESGLLHNSAVRCERLHTIPQSDIRRSIGRLPEMVIQHIDTCLKASLGIS
ncbi:MAG: type II toxin-antitoxin system PemK/MazF family toxin [Planctomycetaceae bacterium]|nr:MAG: type II toxin-antitoxin system PemK/MazF family toxin [Planctomycetaceae bacterium]